MNIEELRTYCLSKDRTTEDFPFDKNTLVFRINNKIFLLTSLDSSPLQFNVKCDPEEALELRDRYSEAIFPGYHMNKKHWNTVICSGKTPPQLLLKMIDDSYRLVSRK